MPQSISPYSLQLLGSFDLDSSDVVQQKIEKSSFAFSVTKSSSFVERKQWLVTIATRLLRDKEELARTISLEMGKLIGEAISEVEKCAWVCRYYAEHSETFLQDRTIETDASNSYVSYQPLGPVLAIMPWNFPFWQVFRFAAPALMAGNTVLLKHASNVPQCALMIEDIVASCATIPGIFQTLMIDTHMVEAVIASENVMAVTLTGSEPAGIAVASAAAKHIKKCVLELGGSDPYIVLGDADLSLAMATCFQARTMNAGQSCIAAKRFIVHTSVEQAFRQGMQERFSTLRYGDPLDPNTSLAPMAGVVHRDHLHQQVQRAIGAGAELIVGGTLDPSIDGAYYPPTLLTNVSKSNPISMEETFGPVATIYPFDQIGEAIDIANATPFGLGAAIFSRDAKRAEHIAKKELNAGSCFVNAQVKSDPRLPFGGIKKSGYGRELGEEGIREFCNIKTLYVG